MKMKHALSLLQEGMTTVKVYYNEANHNGLRRKKYTFKVKISDNIKVGDTVVVHTNDELKLCEVVEVDLTADIDMSADYNYTWIVQKVDMEAYAARLEREQEFNKAMAEVQRTAQREEIRKALMENLGTDSTARKLFDGALKSLNQTIEGEK